jgi:ABC-type phosphate/phosphonate transport system substrate-binding protein
MLLAEFVARQRHQRNALILSLITMTLSLAAGDSREVRTLQIGTSGSLTPADETTEKGALDALGNLIKDQTGLEAKIVRQNGWRELADNLAKGKLKLGFFRGYEFAWASEKNPHLKPLVVASKESRSPYSVVSVMTRRDNLAKDFDGLQNQSLTIPDTGERDLRLFIDRSTRANGRRPEEFFSKISSPHNVVEALDDVVDGKVQATVVDQSILEAYQREKPGRFARLREIARSKPLPPTVLAYDDRILDEATTLQIRARLVNSADKEKQEITLGLFHWARFAPVPEDFDKVLAETRKAYPPPTSHR